MSLRFTVLASGSSGNASLVEADGFGLLIDAGLGPRQLASRLAAAGSSWAAIRAVLLTHTHSDHWKDRTLAHLCRQRIPLYCHPDSHADLRRFSPAFTELAAAGLIQPFEAGEEFLMAQGLRCRPLPLRHDSGATFGFRIEGPRDLFGQGAAVGYVADLGCWDEALADALADVDLLAVEFNHDRAMELASGRSQYLIGRVLGDEGHLSNTQGAALVRAVLGRSEIGRIRHLVQLHLSRHCNRPTLAREAVKSVLDDLTFRVELHTARQDEAGITLHLGAAPDAGKRTRRTTAGRSRRQAAQLSLPGPARVQTRAYKPMPGEPG